MPHLDLDSFFVSVEVLKNSALKEATHRRGTSNRGVAQAA
jgi:hypothetical protein